MTARVLTRIQKEHYNAVENTSSNDLNSKEKLELHFILKKKKSYHLKCNNTDIKECRRHQSNPKLNRVQIGFLERNTDSESNIFTLSSLCHF